MRSTLIMIALAILIAAVPQSSERRNGMAIPIARHSGLATRNVDDTVDFDALNNHVAAIRSKILRGFDNFERNTGQVHPSAPKGVRKRGDPDPLTYYTVGYFSMEYYGTIAMDTSDNSFTVAFDTASSDLLIPSTDCPATCNGHNLWNPYTSTAQDLHQSFSINYGNGNTTAGEQYTGTVFLTEYMAKNQVFGAVWDYASGFQSYQFPADGLLGLAFNTISDLGHASPVFQTLVNQGQLPEPVFSFKLAHSGGELYVGGSNIALYTGDFSYVPVTPNSNNVNAYWEVTVETIGPDSQQTLTNINCIIDTTAYLIIGDPPNVFDLHINLNGLPIPSGSGFPDGYYTIPCDDIPTLVLTLGGSPFLIPPADLNLGRLGPNSTQCVSAIISQDDISNSWILGDVFLRNVYTRFDVANAQVGFASLA